MAPSAGRGWRTNDESPLTVRYNGSRKVNVVGEWVRVSRLGGRRTND